MFDVYLNQKRDHVLVVAKGQPIPIHQISERWRKKKAAVAVSDEIKSAVQTSGYYSRKLRDFKRAISRSHVARYSLDRTTNDA